MSYSLESAYTCMYSPIWHNCAKLINGTKIRAALTLVALCLKVSTLFPRVSHHSLHKKGTGCPESFLYDILFHI